MPLPTHLATVLDLILAGRTQGEVTRQLNLGNGVVSYRYRRALMLLSTGRYNRNNRNNRFSSPVSPKTVYSLRTPNARAARQRLGPAT